MGKFKRLLTIQNLTFLLILLLGAHNYYLQTKIDIAIGEARDAKDYARWADDNSEKVALNSQKAADEASDAARYAESAEAFAASADRILSRH